MSESVAFDRASEYYDATRSLPATVAAEVTDALMAELAGSTRVLEIGVGTGRIALPLAERGVDVVGLDLSPAHVGKLVAKAGGTGLVPVTQADATRLPVASAGVDAVLACHVFHLIPPWRAAVDEVIRVLRPDGVLLVDMGGPHPTPWSVDATRILAAHGITRERTGLADRDQLNGYLTGRLRGRPLAPIALTFRQSLASELDDWERQIMGWTWRYPPAQMASACAEIRAWALAGGHPLDVPVDIHDTVEWWAYRS